MLPADVVARESAAWIWRPDDGDVVETADYVLVRWPAYVGSAPSLMRFTPMGDPAAAFSAALDRARSWACDELIVWVRLEAPAGFEELVRAQGGVLHETVDVFALDLADGPAVDAPDVELRWRDVGNSRDFVEVGIAAFEEGEVPDEETLRWLAEDAEADRLAGRGAHVLAYANGRPVGAAGLTMAGTTARLWGGGVVPEARGRGIYRALLRARIGYALEHGATMALVKGRVESSGPILRRCGFESYGQERAYLLGL